LVTGKLLKDPTNPTFTLFGNVDANAGKSKMSQANILGMATQNNV